MLAVADSLPRMTSPSVIGRHVYDPRDLPNPNEWDLSGDWTITQEAAVLNRAGGRITCAFHALDVNLVVGPSARGATIPFRVTLDGGPVDGAPHGFDVDADGRGTVTRQDTLQLVRQNGSDLTDRVVQIEFLVHRARRRIASRSDDERTGMRSSSGWWVRTT